MNKKLYFGYLMDLVANGFINHDVMSVAMYEYNSSGKMIIKSDYLKNKPGDLIEQPITAFSTLKATQVAPQPKEWLK